MFFWISCFLGDFLNRKTSALLCSTITLSLHQNKTKKTSNEKSEADAYRREKLHKYMLGGGVWKILVSAILV